MKTKLLTLITERRGVVHLIGGVGHSRLRGQQEAARHNREMARNSAGGGLGLDKSELEGQVLLRCLDTGLLVTVWQGINDVV